jgi:UDP-N-acetylmuramate-alanine ligase
MPALDDLPEAVAVLVRPGDLVITLGAGSIGGVGERILEAIRNRRPQPAANGESR